MEKETKDLLDHCVEYATELLMETGESYPFGGFIDTIGQVHPLEMEIDKKNVPTIGKVIQALGKYGEEEIKEGRMHSYAVTYEAAVKLSEDQTQDCIAIDITCPSDPQPVFYLPFNKVGDKVSIGELFAVAR
ncbi:MAG: hypothetical protein R2780_10775 [Crocinitomicaceae bacterium]